MENYEHAAVLQLNLDLKKTVKVFLTLAPVLLMIRNVILFLAERCGPVQRRLIRRYLAGPALRGW